jgi:sugar/nucleoside kinase (ribokinase family)
MSGKRWEVITFGDVFIDLVMSGFTRWPEPGEEVTARSLTQDVGGGAAITACRLAQLGRRVALIAAVGEDGGWFRQRIGRCGVDCDLLQIDEAGRTATTVAISTIADRSFFTFPGANVRLAEMLADQTITSQMSLAQHVHLASAVEPARLVELTRQLHQSGTTISVDVGWVESWLRDPASLVALREVDLFLPNEREGRAMTGETDPELILRTFAQAGIARVALKLGAAGAMMIDAGQILACAAPVVEVVDTTGAGDCFDAGFISAWIDGQAAANCLQLGNACGAQSTTTPGGTGL